MKSIFGWLVVFLGATWIVKNNVITIPSNVQQTFQNGISQITTGLDSIVDSNWNFNQNASSNKDTAVGAKTPSESIVDDKNLSKIYYYSFADGTSDAVRSVFNQAIATYNATGIVQLKPGETKGWLNHITLGTYQKAMPAGKENVLELGVGGPEIMEQRGLVSRIANHASAKLNIYYGKSISQSVATHEIGHALGLDHSTSLRSIMYPLDRGQVTLSQADINGLKAIYGEANSES